MKQDLKEGMDRQKKKPKFSFSEVTVSSLFPYIYYIIIAILLALLLLWT